MVPLEIQKFGGTSMADAEAVQQSGSVVANSFERKKAILVVTSAMSGVTDKLSAAARAAEMRLPGQDPEVILRDVAQRTHKLIEDIVEPTKTGPLHQMVDKQTDAARGDMRTMTKFKLLSPMSDWICAKLGEGFSAPIFAAHLQGAGIDARYYDADSVLVTDGNYGSANPLIKSTRENIRTTLAPALNQGRVVVMGGYYGADRDGRLTTFSRGGSDLSATTMGHVLTPFFNPVSVTLYKADVAGVLSADPKVVENPHIIPHMLYEEAAALTSIGGKVIHPKAVHQAVRSGSSKRLPFPIYVKSTLDPDSPGTVIDNLEREEDGPIKAVSLIKDAVRLTVTGWGMDRPGIMKGITEVLAQRGIDIDLISQPYSKLALDLVFQFTDKETQLEEAIRGILSGGIKNSDIDEVNITRVGVIGVIGKGISHPSILSRVIEGMNGSFPELEKPNSYKLTTGEYEASILADLPEERLKDLTRSIHHSVFER